MERNRHVCRMESRKERVPAQLTQSLRASGFFKAVVNRHA